MAEVSLSNDVSKINFSDGTGIEVSAESVVITIGSGGGGAVTAEDVSIADAGNYYTSDNVEGALQEVGADLAVIDGQIIALQGDVSTLQTDVTTLQGQVSTNTTDIATLQGEVSAIIEPITGEGITVAIDGSVNLGGGGNVSGAKNVVLEDTAIFYIRNDAQTKHLLIDDGNIVELYSFPSTIQVLGADGIVITGPTTITPYARYIKELLTASLGLVAWDMATKGCSTYITLTASATLSNPTNMPATSNTLYMDLEVIQGGSGGYTLSFGSNFVLPANWVAPETAVGSRTLYHFQTRQDGKIAVVYTYYSS